MLLMELSTTRVWVDDPMPLDEYLALPEDARTEIVDGVLRPMTRTSKLHREVQFNLCMLLKSQRPRELRVAEEEVIVLEVEPATARIPDVSIFRPTRDPDGRTNNTRCSDVLLCAEVVSRSTATADRVEKPIQFAHGGIPSFWRIELEPEIEVIVHRLVDGHYQETGRFKDGDVAVDSTLDWIRVPVRELLGDYAR